jgi:hypothetical protein
VESSHFQGQRSLTYISMEETHIHDCVYSGKVHFEDNNRFASQRIFCLEPPVQVTKFAAQTVREIMTLPP